MRLVFFKREENKKANRDNDKEKSLWSIPQIIFCFSACQSVHHNEVIPAITVYGPQGVPISMDLELLLVYLAKFLSVLQPNDDII